MTLERLPSGLRRAVLATWYVAFFATIFVYFPSLFVDLNAEMAWPGWQSTPTRWAGVAGIVGGIAMILYCTGLFVRRGRGTPVPAAPPQELVLQGPYRFSRNPIYVAYVAVWLGIFLVLGHAALALYAALGTAALVGVVRLWEEPELERRFGSRWLDYCRAAPRWIPLRWARTHTS